MANERNSSDHRPLKPEMTEICIALGKGDPQQVLALIEAGADLHYKRDGYDALLDAVHGRDITHDPHLLELLALLIAHNVDLSGVSEDAESGLRVLSRLGRFDAVRLLLEAGADESHLEWTPLMYAVALGSLADVQAALEQGADLEARDWWSRTPWLIALLTGDIAKAALLLEWGADFTAQGRCGNPPLFYPIQGRHPPMLRWLLDQGADIHQSDDFGSSALIEAVDNDDLECIDILIEAGADLEVKPYGTALANARSRKAIMRLLDAGANPTELRYEGQRLILRLPPIDSNPLKTLLPDDFHRDFARRFGEVNPQQMNIPFWEAMICSGVSAYQARLHFEQEPLAQASSPVWCADRFGQSLTLLPGDYSVS